MPGEGPMLLYKMGARPSGGALFSRRGGMGTAWAASFAGSRHSCLLASCLLLCACNHLLRLSDPPVVACPRGECGVRLARVRSQRESERSHTLLDNNHTLPPPCNPFNRSTRTQSRSPSSPSSSLSFSPLVRLAPSQVRAARPTHEPLFQRDSPMRGALGSASSLES